MKRPSSKSNQSFTYQSLEPRQLLASDFLSGPVTIAGSSGNDIFSIIQLDDSNVIEIRNDNVLVRQFNADQITSLSFEGNDGDDVVRFVNVTALNLESLELSGGAGNDFFLNENSLFFTGGTLIRGGAGDDVIDLGFVGGFFIEDVEGGAGNDLIIGSNRGERLDGGSGNDLIYGGGGDDQINGGAGNDRIDGGAGDDVLRGDEGDDEIRGGITRARVDGSFEFGGFDFIAGGDGNDRLNGGDGRDEIEGNDGDDQIAGWWGSDELYGGRGDDLLLGGFGSDTISGSAESRFQALFREIPTLGPGETDDDELYGNADNDQLQDLNGTNLLNGGPGDDRNFEGEVIETGDNDPPDFPAVDFGFPNSSFPAQPVIPELPLATAATDGTEALISIDGDLRIVGTELDDSIVIVADPISSEFRITGFGNDGTEERSFAAADVLAIRFFGFEGDDTLAYTGDATIVLNRLELQGDAGNDSFTVNADFEDFDQALSGGFATVTAFGGDGNDRIEINGSAQSNQNGGAGDDVLIGGSGRDRISGVTGEDTILGRGGTDDLIGGAGDDIIDGGSGDDSINGGGNNDQLSGGVASTLEVDGFDEAGGDDFLNGGAGNDVIEGGDGEDLIQGSFGDDEIRGGSGNDTIEGNSGRDRIFGDNGDDTIFGDREFESNGDDDDEIFGGNGNDRIEAGGGNDLVVGGNGDDNIEGGAGDDTLRGSAGNDRLVGQGGNDLINGWLGDDLIFGGNGDDLLVGGNGADRIFGQGGADVLLGQEGDDALEGGFGADFLAGGAGDDSLGGTAIIETSTIPEDGVVDGLRGDDGNDRFFVSGINIDLFVDFNNLEDVQVQRS